MIVFMIIHHENDHEHHENDHEDHDTQITNYSQWYVFMIVFMIYNHKNDRV